MLRLMQAVDFGANVEFNAKINLDPKSSILIQIVIFDSKVNFDTNSQLR